MVNCNFSKKTFLIGPLVTRSIENITSFIFLHGLIIFFVSTTFTRVQYVQESVSKKITLPRADCTKCTYIKQNKSESCLTF